MFCYSTILLCDNILILTSVMPHKGWKKFSKIHQFWSSLEADGGK